MPSWLFRALRFWCNLIGGKLVSSLSMIIICHFPKSVKEAILSNNHCGLLIITEPPSSTH